MNYRVPFGDGVLEFEVTWGADVAEHSLITHSADLQILPIERGDYERALILFTDATRQSPDQWFAEKLLAALPFSAEQIQFLCAIGMHRPSTQAEKIAKLGQAIVERYVVEDHDPAQVIQIGEIDGIPVEVNRTLMEPGTLVIAMGVVEPHQYAGYSGGTKTAVIGCGGEKNISRTHSASMLAREGVRLGVVEGNPFQDFVRKAGVMIGLTLVANAVMPEPGKIAAAQFGEAVAVHDALVQQARKLYEVPVPDAPYDVVIAGVGAPKDANLYQASRAATYIGLSGTSVLRDGGVIILPAEMPEGAGMGQGERNFFEILQRFHPTPQLIQYLEQNGCRPGEQRAYMIAQMMARYHCMVVGAADPSIVEAVGLTAVPTMEAAMKRATAILGNPHPKTLVVPHAVQTLPVPAYLRRLT